MNTNIVSLSLKSANAFKKARGFQKVETAGVEKWVKTTDNAINGLTHQIILPSGTNVIYTEDAGSVTKKIIKPDGTFFRSIFSKYKRPEGQPEFVCATKVNLKDYALQRFTKDGPRTVKEDEGHIRNNILGNLSLFSFMFK